MAVKQDAITGSGAPVISSLGGPFGLTDDEYNAQVKTGDQRSYVPYEITGDTYEDGTPIPQSKHNAQVSYTDAKGKRQLRDFGSMETRPVQANMGDEIKKVSSWAHSSNDDERKKFLAIQEELYNGGFMSQKPTKGVVDDATLAGLTSAFKSAVRGGVTFDEVLAKATADGGSRKARSRTIQLTQPTDVKTAIQNLAPTLIGHGVDQSTIDNIMQGFNSLEATNQNAVADASDAAAAGTGQSTISYNPPSLNNYVSEQLRQSDPVAAQGQQLGNFLSEFIGLMGRGGSASSSTFGSNQQNATG